MRFVQQADVVRDRRECVVIVAVATALEASQECTLNVCDTP